MEEKHTVPPAGPSRIPLLSCSPALNPVDRKYILGKRKTLDNVSPEQCDTCGEMINNQRELRLHNANEYITEFEVRIGTKRDESFMKNSELSDKTPSPPQEPNKISSTPEVALGKENLQEDKDSGRS